MRTLVIAVFDSSDQLACVHLAESDEEYREVMSVAASLGPVWSFEICDGELLQYWPEPDRENYAP